MKNTTRLSALVLAITLGLPSVVAAHIRVTASTPAAGSTSTVALREVRITFSQRVGQQFTQIAVIGPTGTVVPLVGIAPSDSTHREFVATLAGPLGNGDYTVRWRTAGADGHVINGEFAFRVEAVVLDTMSANPVIPAPAGLPPRGETSMSDANSGVGAIVVRWANFLALLLALGVVAMQSIIVPGSGVATSSPEYYAKLASGLRSLAILTGALVMLAAIPRLLLQTSALYGRQQMLQTAGVKALALESAWGIGWLIQLGAGGALVLAGALRSRVLAVAGAILLAATPGLSGHAVGVAGAAGLAVGSDALHVLAAGSWLGSLAVILMLALPTASRTPESHDALADVVRAFSPVALIAALVLLLTGVAAALLQTTSLSQLWTTGYGRAILIKLAFVAVLAALGRHNWKRVRPTLGQADATRVLRRSAGFELGIALAVVLVTAVLVALPTPH